MRVLGRVVFWQLFVWFLTVLLFFIFGSHSSAVSALLGGAACAIPSFLLVLILFLDQKRGSSPYTIFIGEFFKMLLTIISFVGIVLLYKELNWAAMLVCGGAVLMSHLFALASRH